jgi:hypothetical protein
MAYTDKDGILNPGHNPVVEVKDAKIPAGKGSWAKISGFWVGKHDLFECQPYPAQIGRNGGFFTALSAAETLLPLFSVSATKDLRGGSVIVRLFAPGTDQAVFYKVEKNLYASKELPDHRHTAYWVYMMEKAFAWHRMQYNLPAPDGGKPKDYLAALKGTTFGSALEMIVGRTRAGELTRNRQVRVRAVERLHDLHHFDDYAARAVQLIMDPNAVDQDCFGVCGMASTIHVVLKFRPGRFADILHSVFNGEDFKGGVGKLKIPIKISAHAANYQEVIKDIQTGPAAAGEPPTDVSALLAKRIDQYKHKMAVKPSQKPWAKLDFIVSRSLARMLKITDPALYNDQKEFTKKFADPAKPNVDLVKMGDMAFTEAGVVYVLTDIIGVPDLSFVANPSGPENIIKAVNAWFQKYGDHGAFGIAAINPFYETKDDKRWWFFPDGRNVYPGLKSPARNWVQPAWQPYEFAHWIVINGKIEDRNFWWLPIWTWARQWEGRLHKIHTAGYLHSVILARLEPE